MTVLKKEELMRYRRLTEEIWSEEERLWELEGKMKNISATSCVGCAGQTDYIYLQTCIKDEIANKLQSLKADARERRKQIERCMEESDLTPFEKRIIRQRYIDHNGWCEIEVSIYGSRSDFYEREDTYRRQMYRIHGQALKKLHRCNTNAGATAHI